ncbi:MAG: hypothetical protein R6X33_03575 [Candidatus Brocadiia bacterium]
MPDYYVVHGYDEEGNYLFHDFDGSVGRTHHTKLGDTGIGLCYLMIVHPREAADERVTVRQALEFALEVAEGKHGHGGEYATGLAGYDRWIAALEEPETILAGDVAGFGMAYNAACWAECRRHSVGFLREARERLDDADLNVDFGAAIDQYGSVAGSLSKVSELFPFELGADAEMRERLQDGERRSGALEALRTARDAETKGIEVLARIAEALGTAMAGD